MNCNNCNIQYVGETTIPQNERLFVTYLGTQN